MGRYGSLVDFAPFFRRAAGSNPALAAKYGPWAMGMISTRSCLWPFGVKLRHSIHAVSRAPLSCSGLEGAL